MHDGFTSNKQAWSAKQIDKFLTRRDLYDGFTSNKQAWLLDFTDEVIKTVKKWIVHKDIPLF